MYTFDEICNFLALRDHWYLRDHWSDDAIYIYIETTTPQLTSYTEAK